MAGEYACAAHYQAIHNNNLVVAAGRLKQFKQSIGGGVGKNSAWFSQPKLSQRIANDVGKVRVIGRLNGADGWGHKDYQ